MLQVKKLTKRFGGLTAVADFSFHLEDHQLLGLIGPNGAGKTTVFNLLSGVYKPTSGRVILDGRDITGLPPHRLTRRGIVRTFQNVRLMKGVSLGGNMRPVFHLKKISSLGSSLLQNSRYWQDEDFMRERIDDVLTQLGIIAYRDVFVEDMPYGVQKRAELARALLFQPKILLLDEPAAGLNPQETGEIMEIIRQIHQSTDTSIILVEHNMKFVMGLSQKVIVMDQGFIIAEGAPEEVQAHPDVIKAYLGERAWRKQIQARRSDAQVAPAPQADDVSGVCMITVVREEPEPESSAPDAAPNAAPNAAANEKEGAPC
ncbi:ABC transporter ATP-binding protein [Desulfovibrio sp. OttesenSCG-928-C14]|nr:ABC transporter ATP-binding protein [Desulfovibrio sp. OttesenSCG-928-C14]